MQHTIGIDISKDTLDVYCPADKRHIQMTNDKAGHKALIHWITKGALPLIVFEATGAYHRQLEMALGKSHIPFTKVNPRQARRFAEATGRLAKTEPPRVYRRVFCSKLRLLYQDYSDLHRRPPLLLVA